jgi:hypothetical protein
MAEIGPGPNQYLGRITGANQQLGAGATFPHPLGAQALTTRIVKRVQIRASDSNTGNVTVSNQTAPGNAVVSLLPGESREYTAFNAGERFRLGSFWLGTTGTDYAEVYYTL